MTKVLICGAGSIGNHLAYACRNKGFEVAITDIDTKALERTKEDIYPARYGKWDESIKLLTTEESERTKYDLVIIGTPPDTHLKVATRAIEKNEPKIVLIEKPLCTPDLTEYSGLVKVSKEKKCKIIIGYNHIHTENTIKAQELLQEGRLGEILSITVRWIEHWGGIFGAHPWLSGPQDSYLGFSSRGGGSCGEHSHGINIFQHFSKLSGKGRIKKVSCTMDKVVTEEVDYDRNCLINVVTENGLVGSIAQDVITKPAEKMVRIQGENGFLEWYAGYKSGDCDAILLGIDCQEKEEVIFKKTRPDDFIGEIDEIERILTGQSSGENISLACGYETMKVVEASYKSNDEQKTIVIDY